MSDVEEADNNPFKHGCASPEHETFSAWAAWHPTKGFDKHHYEGAFAFADLCDELTAVVADLNDQDGTNPSNGWRAVRVSIAKVQI